MDRFDYESECEYRDQAYRIANTLGRIEELLNSSRTYGVWNGKGFMLRSTSDPQLFYTNHKGVALAQARSWEFLEIAVREIGPDGFPVEEEAVTS